MGEAAPRQYSCGGRVTFTHAYSRFSRFLGSPRLIQMRILEEKMWNYGGRIPKHLLGSRRGELCLCGRRFPIGHGIRGGRATLSHIVMFGSQGTERGGDRSEYDREEKAIVENRGCVLGLTGEWEGKHSWYGGKIQQVITLRVSGNPGQERYEFELEKPKISRSHCLSRFLGSRRLIQMQIPDQTMWNYRACITEYLSRHSFAMWGRGVCKGETGLKPPNVIAGEAGSKYAFSYNAASRASSSLALADMDPKA
ncbi:hypothetical protein CONPUDRAFT_163120 [Coniophora puteana RWD-64-598 SS2]|uniref:Uncharacterized protein n=1 Tax=Coniophora puteana (strain RWD-64-598) TaxID=741705 RepID=A0A5M3MXT1_CONPW|nr:uncharacterized protein CONPUDRAFT_163120 [Coniophora puteana RWD-64-598 SS2]EIW83836.1 hypothetical protein CONPUDRAFT_163120 [Coniophora puteana RWD-64-598 SS2]